MSVSSYRSLEGLRVCGSSLPPPFTSSQDHVWIHFHSDESLTGKGFRLSYISGWHLDSLGPPKSVEPHYSGCEVAAWDPSSLNSVVNWDLQSLVICS